MELLGTIHHRRKEQFLARRWGLAKYFVSHNQKENNDSNLQLTNSISLVVA
jgi:hypothetical protein